MTNPLEYRHAGNLPNSGYYRHSNRVGPLGIIVGGLGGIVVGLLAAIIYTYLLVWIPLIYAKLFCVFGFGAVLGYVPSKLMKWGKVRSLPIALTIAALVALTAYLFHWVLWAHALLDDSNGSTPSLQVMLLNPLAVARFIGKINDVGTWAMSSGHNYTNVRPTNVSGAFLSMIWFCEAVGILGTAMFIAVKMQTATPYCEACDTWCWAGTPIRSLRPCNGEDLRTEFEKHNWACLDQIDPKPAGASTWMQIIHHRCPKCNSMHTLSVELVQLRRDRNGNTKQSKKCVVRKLRVDAADVAAVRGYATAQPGSNTGADRAAEALSSMMGDEQSTRPAEQ